MKEIYKKIEIKSKEDLPKNTNTYFVSYRDNSCFIIDEKKVLIFRTDSSADASFWLEHVNWYLI